MSDDLITILQMITTAVAVGVSVAALVVSHRRAHALFAQQQRDSVLPRLRIIASYWTNHKSILLTNCGVGTAVVDSISFEKNGNQSRRTLADLFDLPDDLGWDTWVLFHSDEPFLLRPGETAPLLQLSQRGLQSQGVDAADALRRLQAFQRDFVGTRVAIEYSDVYENTQDQYTTEILDCHVSAYRPDDSTGIAIA